jgi:hypothetical protein
MSKEVALLVVLLLVVGIAGRAQEATRAGDQPGTNYGVKNTNAARELEAFAFFIGKWEGSGRTRLPGGKVVEYPLTWIWRYILDGTAIADEVHAPNPDGTPAIGISFRQYDVSRKGWVVEFLVPAKPSSQFFPQVRPGAGSVTVNGRTVTVISDPPAGSVRRVREHYQPGPDTESWVYRNDESTDGGKSWNENRHVYTLRRAR